MGGLLALDTLVADYRIAPVSCAKKAAAFFRIARSSRKIRFSRRVGAALLVAAAHREFPSSRSACLSHAAASRRHPELAGNLRVRLPAGTRQPDRLGAKLRRIGWQMLGHENTSSGPSSPSLQVSTKAGQLHTLDIYSHVLPEMQREAAHTLDRLLRGAPEA
jgi:hypothetical protein